MKKIYKNLLMILFIIYFVVTLVSQQKVLNEYRVESKTYSKELKSQEELNKKLNETKDNIDSDAYIEEVAREKLDMYLPNERVYIDMEK